MTKVSKAAAGGAKTFRDVAIDDYLQRRLEMGAAWGLFKSEPMLKLWAAGTVGPVAALALIQVTITVVVLGLGRLLWGVKPSA